MFTLNIYVEILHFNIISLFIAYILKILYFLMIHFIFSKIDNRYLFLKCDTKEDEINIGKLISEINLVDPICYLPTYKGLTYTQDFIWKYTKRNGEVLWYSAIGMWQPIYNFFVKNNIQFDGLFENSYIFKNTLKHSFKEFKEIVDSWNLKYKPRDYQYEAAYKILMYKQSLSVLATRAGKTLISYIVFRYAKTYMDVKHILMIVPSIDLVKQGYNDFNEYAEYFNGECIWSGGKLVESADLTIGTFQSLIKFLDKKSKKYNPRFFDKYDCVFVDEVHRATAEQTKTIISQPFMKLCKIVFGMTGTLPKEKSIPRYVLHSLLGGKIQEIKPKQLMDEGYIAKVDIHQQRLHYDTEEWIEYIKDLWLECAEYGLSDFLYEKDEEKNRTKRIKLENQRFLLQYKKRLPNGIQIVKNDLYKKMGEWAAKESYIETLKDIIHESTKTNMLQIERMIVHMLNERVEFLCNNIITKCKGNTILFCHHTEYLKYINDVLTERFKDRIVVYISGAVSPKKRDEIKRTLKENNNCILVASYACVGTGLTLSNLCNGILFESFKSEVINMQSIGRGLGLSELRDTFILYDIVDVFDKDLTNKIYLQGLERIKIYKNNEYKFTVENYNIKKQKN